MIRSFSGAPIDLHLLRGHCELALLAPTAGNSAGVRFTVVSTDKVGDYFDVATDESWRATAARFPGLARAGAVVLVSCRPEDYEARYRETDKAASGLSDRAEWPIPYWHTDAAMATMALLLLIEEAGLGATLWGAFRHVDAVRQWAGLEDELFATVLIGVPDGEDVPSRSLQRPVPSRAERVRVL